LKRKDIEVFLAIIFYLLAISEEVLKLGLFNWLYSTLGQTAVFALLLIIATAFVATYVVTSLFQSKAVKYTAILGRTRPPPNKNLQQEYVTDDYGVKWITYEPNLFDAQPWADGPYCPECDRELDVMLKGHFFKKEIWKCPMCGSEYPKPKGDVKDMVEKNFAAYLRKKGRL
jgi:ribosomal protein L37AE/L43A